MFAKCSVDSNVMTAGMDLCSFLVCQKEEDVVSSMNTCQTCDECILRTRQHVANHCLTVNVAHLLYTYSHLL